MKATDSRGSLSSSAGSFATVSLFGLPFINASTEAAVAEQLLGDRSPIPSGTHPVVVTPNVDIVVQLEGNPSRFRRSDLLRCAYVLPDGAPIVWTSRLAGTPLQSRLAGSNLFQEVWPRLVEENRPVAVLCSSEAVRAGLLAEYPTAVVIVAPMIDTSEEQIGAVADQLVEAASEIGAEFCMVCIGHPKDPLVALACAERWPTGRQPLMLGLGASAEMYLGLRRRAPAWAQRYGLEWLVRFAQEPRRMFRRYFVRDLRFIPLMVREILARRRP